MYEKQNVDAHSFSAGDRMFEWVGTLKTMVVSTLHECTLKRCVECGHGCYNDWRCHCGMTEEGVEPVVHRAQIGIAKVLKLEIGDDGPPSYGYDCEHCGSLVRRVKFVHVCTEGCNQMEVKFHSVGHDLPAVPFRG